MTTRAAARLPGWAAPLGATLLMQITGSMVGQSIAVAGPVLTASLHIAPQRIGELSALSALGTLLFFAFGGPVLARLGPVRMLQVGAALAAAGMVLAGVGWWPVLVLAVLVQGVGYAPVAPASSRILAETAPHGHRALIFCIKQSGAPAGNALAGLLVAPAALLLGWRLALVLAGVVGLVAAVVIAPLRGHLDRGREPARPIHPGALFHWQTLVTPVRALREDGDLARLTVLAVSYAVAQGCLFAFTVTYLATVLGFGLRRAGLAYAVLQGAGIVARIGLGLAADRSARPARNLAWQGVGAATMVALFALLPVHAPMPMVLAVCALTGLFAASWNGIFLAEVARLAPPGRVADATSGSLMFIFATYVIAPAGFSALISLVGGWRLPLLLLAAQLGVVALWQSVVLARRGRAG